MDERNFNLPIASFVPSDGSPEELFALWQYAVEPYFHTFPIGGFDKDSENQRCLQINAGEYLFIDCYIKKQRFVRSFDRADQYEGSDHVLIQFYITGKNDVVLNGHEFTISRGIYIVNLAYELEAVATNSSILTIALRREWVNRYIPSLLKVNGRLFNNSMAEKIFESYMIMMRTQLVHCSFEDSLIIRDGMLSLLKGFEENFNFFDFKENKDITMRSLKIFIEENIRNPELSVELILDNFPMSRAKLYRLFNGLGGVNHYILNKKLMCCFYDISTPYKKNKKVSEIASEFGFFDFSYFSKIFKKKFGVSPRKIREDLLFYIENKQVQMSETVFNVKDSIDLMRRWSKNDLFV